MFLSNNQRLKYLNIDHNFTENIPPSINLFKFLAAIFLVKVELKKHILKILILIYLQL